MHKNKKYGLFLITELIFGKKDHKRKVKIERVDWPKKLNNAYCSTTPKNIISKPLQIKLFRFSLGMTINYKRSEIGCFQERGFDWLILFSDVSSSMGLFNAEI